MEEIYIKKKIRIDVKNKGFYEDYYVDGEQRDRDKVFAISGNADIYIDGKLKYSGEIGNCIPRGRGVLYDDNGEVVFDGIFVHGDPYEGTYIYKDLGICKGYFKNHKPNGNCIFFYNNKSIYSGNFENGIPNGNGVLIRDGNMYAGGFYNGKYNGKGIYKNEQGTFDGIFENNMAKSGSFILKNGGQKIYTLETQNDGGKKLTYFIDGQEIVLTIDANNKMVWSGNITEETKKAAKQILNSFNEKESVGYNCLLGNLTSINTDKNIVQFSNNSDFHERIDFKDQLDKFITFAERRENKGKLVTSELYTNDHAVGIIYNDGKILVVDTSGGVYLDTNAVDLLKNKQVKILSQDMQKAGNCVVTSRMFTNEIAKCIANRENGITIDNFIKYCTYGYKTAIEPNEQKKQENKYFFEGKHLKDILEQKAKDIHGRYEKLHEVDKKLLAICMDKQNKFVYPKDSYISTMKNRIVEYSLIREVELEQQLKQAEKELDNNMYIKKNIL
ncbi:MAG: hypothetical protein IJ853_03785 [Rickettsiales bacterium]|nr:hypothetical protein [Rickettsiales bacterium]